MEVNTPQKSVLLEQPQAEPGRRPLIRWISDATKVFRTGGFKGLVSTYGWKLVAVFFVYYLTRDLTLYVLVPWLVTKGVLSLHH